MPPTNPHIKCRHGYVVGENRLPPGAYAAPIGTCRCCGSAFMYVAFGSYTRSETKTIDPDPTLCPDCDGQPHIYHQKDGVVLAHETGSAYGRH